MQLNYDWNLPVNLNQVIFKNISWYFFPLEQNIIFSMKRPIFIELLFIGMCLVLLMTPFFPCLPKANIWYYFKLLLTYLPAWYLQTSIFLKGSLNPTQSM